MYLESPRLAVYERFKLFYQNLESMDLDNLGEIYAPDVVFCDPVHRLSGLDKLHHYLSKMRESTTSMRFEYLDELVSSRGAYIKWDMHFSHRKLGEKPICVRGISQINFDAHVTYHEDVYDLGQMIYENVPVLGGTAKWLKGRLAA